MHLRNVEFLPLPWLAMGTVAHGVILAGWPMHGQERASYCSDHPLWKEAMLVELRAILDNDKWTLVSPPAGTSLVSGCVNTYSIQTALSSTTRLVASFMATPSSPPSIMVSPSAPSSSCLPYMMGIG